MSNFTNPISRAPVPTPSQGSRLDSPREANSLQHLWWQQLAQRQLALGQSNGQAMISNRLSGMRARIDTQPNFHPFKIYNYPRALRKYTEDSDYRKIKVHAASVIDCDGSAAGGLAIPGGDMSTLPYSYDVFSQIPPSSPSVFTNTWNGVLQPINDVWNEVIVPDDGKDYYLWVSFVLGACTVPEFSSTGICFGYDNGTDPVITNCLSVQSGNTITDKSSQPGLSPYNNTPYRFFIGSVRVATGPLGKYLKIYQRQNTVISKQGIDFALADNKSRQMRFRGTYSAAAYYYVGDVVRTDDGGTHIWQYVYWPTVGSTYNYASNGVLQTIDPDPATYDDTHPWFLLSKSTL